MFFYTTNRFFPPKLPLVTLFLVLFSTLSLSLSSLGSFCLSSLLFDQRLCCTQTVWCIWATQQTTCLNEGRHSVQSLPFVIFDELNVNWLSLLSGSSSIERFQLSFDSMGLCRSIKLPLLCQYSVLYILEWWNTHWRDGTINSWGAVPVIDPVYVTLFCWHGAGKCQMLNIRLFWNHCSKLY